MTMNAPRAPIDLDASERDRKPSQSPAKAAAPTKSDPLSELARIVGQDDPFRALLEARNGSAPQAGSAAKAARVEPSLYDQQPGAYAQGHHAASHPEAVPVDAFDQYLASVEQVHRGQDEGLYQDPATFADEGAGYRNPKAGFANKRRTLMRVGAGFGVLALCVTGALAWNATRSGGADGNGPVTVLADRSPLKVAPEAADGVEIPDQNKQIYNRDAKDGQIKVVNREEQPIDVNQATRSVAQDGASQGGATPGGTGILTESLGEPRKIRTVAVRPDAPPAAMQAQREQHEPVPAAPISLIPTMQLPEPSTATPAPTSQRATRDLAANAASAAAEPASVQFVETAAEAPAQRKPQQVANAAAPESTASTGETSAVYTPALSGGFAVQIGVQSSEADARAAFRKAQAKYSQLAGKPELIRQAEVNGKAIYRVRVGPLGKSEANSLCSQLKSAGGACFVAAN